MKRTCKNKTPVNMTAHMMLSLANSLAADTRAGYIVWVVALPAKRVGMMVTAEGQLLGSKLGEIAHRERR